MSAALEMASAGGGGSESAAPEADRPQPRPFLIGVSGGTASGKVSALRPGLSEGLARPQVGAPLPQAQPRHLLLAARVCRVTAQAHFWHFLSPVNSV